MQPSAMSYLRIPARGSEPGFSIAAIKCGNHLTKPHSKKHETWQGRAECSYRVPQSKIIHNFICLFKKIKTKEHTNT